VTDCRCDWHSKTVGEGCEECETSKEIKIKHECVSCGGTGLYAGTGERDGAAVVCFRCKGEGWQVSVFKEFTGRKEKPGVRRVFETNPGIIIGEGGNIKLSDFGGMPLADWMAGKSFAPGMENRLYTCPKWWAQSIGSLRAWWPECISSLGKSFSQCQYFGNKSACWARWDEERERAIESLRSTKIIKSIKPQHYKGQ